MTNDLDLDLRNAIRTEAYRAPVHLTAAGLRSRLEADDARQRRRRPLLAALGAVAGLALVVSIVALRPILQRPGLDATGPSPSTACPEALATKHGSWWVEIGGPNAFFNVEPGTLWASSDGETWLIHVRFDPDASEDEVVSIRAEHLASGERVGGSLNGRISPTNIFRLDKPAPRLPGGWYLFEQRLPQPGCWRLVASIDGRVVGAAAIDVGPARPRPSPDPEAPTPFATSRSEQTIDCGRIEQAPCTTALGIAAERTAVVTTVWAVIVDDVCPPSTICDRMYPFMAVVVLVPPPTSASGPLGLLVVGREERPEQVLGSLQDLPDHLLTKVRALGGRAEGTYELACGPLEPVDCSEHAFFAVVGAERQNPTKQVVSLEFTSPDGDYQLRFDDGTAVGLDVN